MSMPAEDDHAHDLAALRAGSRRDRERGTTPRMNANAVIRIGRNRSFAPTRASIHQALALSRARLRELDDQDRVLRGEPDQHDQTDLRKDVVEITVRGLSRDPQAEIRAKGGKRRPEEHAPRQTPAAVLRGQHEEHQEDRNRECRSGIGRALFLIRHVRPVVPHVLRQRGLGGLFERRQRIPRAVPFGRHPGQFGRAIQVEPVGEPGRWRRCRISVSSGTMFPLALRTKNSPNCFGSRRNSGSAWTYTL